MDLVFRVGAYKNWLWLLKSFGTQSDNYMASRSGDKAMRVSAPRVNNPSVPKSSSIDVVAATLANYARRGVFRGFSRGNLKKGRAVFRIVWHWDRKLDLIFDANRGTMRFPLLLPDVRRNSKMHRDLKEFIKSRQSDKLPDHRRIDPGMAHVGCYLRGEDVSVALTVRNHNYEYGARKLIGLVQEIFLVFLADNHYEYMVEAFELDPDRL